MNKFLFLSFFLFIVIFSTKRLGAQIAIESKELLFLLKGEIIDLENSLPVSSAKVKILGSNSSLKTIASNKEGIFETYLAANTNYRISISAPNYITATGTETTTDSRQSKIFVHQYKLPPIETIVHGYELLDLDSTFSMVFLDELKDTIILYRYAKHLSTKARETLLLKHSENKYNLIHVENMEGNDEEVLSVFFKKPDLVEFSLFGETNTYNIVGLKTANALKYRFTKVESNLKKDE